MLSVRASFAPFHVPNVDEDGIHLREIQVLPRILRKITHTVKQLQHILIVFRMMEEK